MRAYSQKFVGEILFQEIHLKYVSLEREFENTNLEGSAF